MMEAHTNNNQIDRINGAAKAAFEITERRILQMQHELKRDISTMMQQITAKLDERHNQLADQLNNIERQMNRMIEGLESSGLIGPGPPPPGPPIGAPTTAPPQMQTTTTSRQPPMAAVVAAATTATTAAPPRQPTSAPPTLPVPNHHRQPPPQQQQQQPPHFYPPPPNAAAVAAAAARRVVNTKQPPPPQQQPPPPPDWRDPRTIQPVVGPLGSPPPASAAAAAATQPPHAPNIPLFPKSVQDLLREHEVLCLEQWKDSNKSHWKSGLPMNYSRRRYVYNKICERAQLLKGNTLTVDEKRQKAAEIMDMEMREKGLSSVYQYLNHLRSLDGTIKRRKRK